MTYTYRELIAELDDILRTQKVLASLRDAFLSKMDVASGVVAIDIVASLLDEQQREDELRKRRRVFDKMENALRDRFRVLLTTLTTKEGSIE